ncbi:MAG: hypothetical protein UHX00_01155 [Caryophanon sp.]|nr:hypothetical protein [Caryophanon sp.]
MKTEHDLFLLALQQGMYLAATMPHTEKYIREQMRKYPNTADHFVPLDVQHAVQSIQVGLGKRKALFTMLEQLLPRFYAMHDRDKALTNYLFMLRNVLCNDAFKVLSKEIERKNRRIESSEQAIDFAKERELLPTWNRYNETQIALFYYFIYILDRGKSFATLAQNGETLIAVRGINALLKEEQALQQRFIALTQFDIETPTDEQNIALIDLCDSADIPNETAQLVRKKGMHIEQLLATTYVSEEEAQALREHEGTPHFAQLVVEAALLQLASADMPVIETSAAAPQKSEPKKQKPAKVAPAMKESPKELAALKQQLQQAAKQIESLEQALQRERKEVKDTKLALSKLQSDFEELTLERDILLENTQPHANALTLLENMQTMMMQLQRELQTTEEEEQEQSITEELAHLKIAVVGGHQNFHSELKKRLPSVSLFIGPDELNFDEKKLLNYDVVILAIHYCNHSLYERVFDYLKRQQAKQKCFVTQLKNVDSIAHEIYYRYLA